MKKAMAIIVSMLFILSFAGQTFARMGMSGAMQQMADKETEGTIESVDLKEKMITVKGMRGPVTAAIDEKTVVRMGKELKTIEDLKVGKKASLFYEVAEGRNIARMIIISLPIAIPEEKKTESKPEANPVSKPEEKK